jgi:hypothetical protein
MENKKINVLNKEIRYSLQNEEDYICLTDMIINKYDQIENWLKNKKTVEFLGVWEKLHNLDFNSVEF